MGKPTKAISPLLGIAGEKYRFTAEESIPAKQGLCKFEFQESFPSSTPHRSEQYSERRASWEIPRRALTGVEEKKQMVDRGPHIQESMRIPHQKVDDDLSYATDEDGTVDMNLSLSTDVSFSISNRLPLDPSSPSYEKTSLDLGTTTNLFSERNGKNIHCNVLSDIVNKERFLAIGSSKNHEKGSYPLFSSQGMDNDVKHDSEVYPSLKPERCDMACAVDADDLMEISATGSVAAQPTSLVGANEGPENFNQSVTSHENSVESNCADGYAMPGAFKVYSKLVELHRAKNMGNEGEIPEPEEKTIQQKRSDQDDVNKVSTTSGHDDETSDRKIKEYKKDWPMRQSEPGACHIRSNSFHARQICRISSDAARTISDMMSNDATIEESNRDMGTTITEVSAGPSKRHNKSLDSCRKPRRLAESETTDETLRRRPVDSDVSESEASHLPTFLEDLSESLSEIARSPRRSILGPSPRVSPRETIMHRRVMQKRRQSTAATAPGATASNTIDHESDFIESSSNSCISDDEDVLFLPALHNRSIENEDAVRSETAVETEDSTSGFTEMHSESIDLEQGRKWPTALTATLVADVSLKDTERARVIEETTQALTANAVAAEVIDLDALINEKVAEVGNPKKRQQRLRCFACFAFVLAMAAVVVTVTLTTIMEPPLSSPTPSPNTSPAPSPFVSGKSAFQNREELVQAIDKYMVALHEGSVKNSSVAQRYGYPMRTWDVSNLKDFSKVFDFSRHHDVTALSDFEKQNPAFRSFNEDLEGWDVSSAINMAEMFATNSKFQGRGLSKWKVDNVVDFSFMFVGNTDLVEDLGSWNTSSAKSMQGMFLSARFHDGIAKWNTSNVETTEMMFEDSPQQTIVDLNGWDVGNVKQMRAMFRASAFNGKIDEWNVRNVRSMELMFADSPFNQNVSNWNTESLEVLGGIFGAGSYQGDLTAWNTSRVSDFSFAFFNSSFSGDISSWDTSNGKAFVATFSLTDSFDGDLSKWDMGNAVDCSGMFAQSTSFTGKGIGGWNVSNLEVATEMFAWTDKFQDDISTWDVAKVRDASRMFASAASFNHSLCTWSNLLPELTNVKEMFLNSGCVDQTTPTLQGNATSLCSTCKI